MNTTNKLVCAVFMRIKFNKIIVDLTIALKSTL
jgi:hypothetical protein